MSYKKVLVYYDALPLIHVDSNVKDVKTQNIDK